MKERKCKRKSKIKKNLKLKIFIIWEKIKKFIEEIEVVVFFWEDTRVKILFFLEHVLRLICRSLDLKLVIGWLIVDSITKVPRLSLFDEAEFIYTISCSGQCWHPLRVLCCHQRLFPMECLGKPPYWQVNAGLAQGLVSVFHSPISFKQL